MLIDVSWRDGCLSHPLPIENGCFVLPDRLGIGFDVDESVLKQHVGPFVKPTGRLFYV